MKNNLSKGIIFSVLGLITGGWVYLGYISSLAAKATTDNLFFGSFIIMGSGFLFFIKTSGVRKTLLALFLVLLLVIDATVFQGLAELFNQNHFMLWLLILPWAGWQLFLLIQTVVGKNVAS